MRLVLESDFRNCDQCIKENELPVLTGEYLVGDKILCAPHYYRQAGPPLYGESGLGALFG